MDDDALSAAARLAAGSPIVIQAVAISRWIGESGPLPLTPRQVLRKQDATAAAAVIGLTLPEQLRSAADFQPLNRPWNLAQAMGLLRADGGTVAAGPALGTWPPGDPELLATWLDGLLTVVGIETGSTYDDAPGADTLVFLTTIQETAGAMPDRIQLIKQSTELSEQFDLDSTFFWPERKIESTAALLAMFGAIDGGEITSLGRWAAGWLLDKLAEPGSELTAEELIADLAESSEEERDEDAWAWLDAQPDRAEAARQLLMAGAAMEPRLRRTAVDVVAGLVQEEALPVWREMVAVPGMGQHAKYALFAMEAGPKPDEAEWRWLAVELAAVALAEKGPDEAVTVLWRVLPAKKLAADDLEHRLAAVRATDHPSALSVAAAIEDFVASAGAEKLSVNQCLQLKVTLARWKPPIWRTVLIPATANLATLHLVIQILYGWDGDHLHAFRVRKVTYSDPEFALEQARDGGAGRAQRRRRQDQLRVRLRRRMGARDRAAEEGAARARGRLPVLRQVQRRLTG